MNLASSKLDRKLEKHRTRKLSQNARTLITVFFLFLFPPIGVVLIFIWMKWPLWVKMLIVIPIVLLFLSVGAFILLIAANPQGRQSQQGRQKLSQCNSGCTESSKTKASLYVCNKSCELETDTQAKSLIQTSRSKLAEARELGLKESLSDSESNRLGQLVSDSVNFARKATEIDPDSSEAWANLGTVYMSLGNIDEESSKFAIKSYSKALELFPENYMYTFAIGSIHYADEQYEEAADSFSSVTKADPELPSGYFLLGMSYKNLGKTEEAKASLQKTLDLLPKDSNDRSVVEKELQTL